MLTIGHRGAAGLEPENTILSFKRAIDLGVDMIEFDVQLCNSGEVVVFHDFTLDRCTNGNGLVIEKTLDELKKLDAGKGQKISTLTESLESINRKVDINIELKGRSTSHKVANIIKHFIDNNHWQMKDFIISSFDHDELLKFTKLMPEIKIGVLYKTIPDNFNEMASALNAFSINANFKFIIKDIVRQIHLKGYQTYAYTVNKKEDKLKMKEMGVDGVFTDFPY